HKGSPRYRIAHGWKIENGSFYLEALNALLENRGVHFTHKYFFFFLILFFLSFIHFFLPRHIFSP
ncbi:hypothetical protein, partial [Salmonella enterica]|uniref:hypothetical protein n=1 Tax=Salmonella enterica TaxID=28901 RepID=UPI003D168D31